MHPISGKVAEAPGDCNKKQVVVLTSPFFPVNEKPGYNFSGLLKNLFPP